MKSPKKLKKNTKNKNSFVNKEYFGPGYKPEPENILTNMNDKEKIQSYIQLYKIQLERYDKRRNFEWKVTMGLWTSIVVLTGFLAGKVHLSWTALGGYIFILIIFSTLWTCGGWLENAKDRNHALVYLNRIEMLLGYTSEEKNYEKPRRLECYKNWSRLFQIMATGIIMFLSWYFLYIIPVS